MKVHQLPLDEFLQSLHTSPVGLTDLEAARRRREFGDNTIPRAAAEPPWRKLAREFVHFFALILWLAAALAFFAEWQSPGQGMGALGIAILLVILINGLFSFWQVHRAEQSLAALEKLLPRAARVWRAGACREIPNQELVPGDVLQVTAGDLVPADCRLIEAFGIRVNHATVTGESQPLSRDAAPCPEEDTLHARNVLLGGTTVLAGDGRAVVFATGVHSEFGRIARRSQIATAPRFPLQMEIERVSRLVAILAATLGAVFFLIGLAVGLPFWSNILFAIGLIVANVPEGLLPTVTLALAMGAQRMARRHVLVRHLPAVETLGCATVICSDKTGTLTENRMQVTAVFTGGDSWFTADGEPFPPISALFRTVLLHCHTLPPQTSNPTVSSTLGDATEIALRAFALRDQPAPDSPDRLDEIPFDSDRKRLVTVEKIGGHIRVLCKGALETVLPLCSSLAHPGSADGQLHCTPLTTADQEAVLRAESKMAQQGHRVLAIAAKSWPDAFHAGKESPEAIESQLTLLGLVALRDPPRPEVPGAIAQCRSAGIRVIMMTGDHPRTAEGVARQIGLLATNSPVVITGEQLRHWSNNQLQLALDSPDVIFARLRADQKMRIVTVLQRKGEIVAMTGDGVNDAPALKQADIGIAMGKTGTDVARETADLVLADDHFAHIVAAIEEGRAVFDNVRKFLTYILTSNVPEILPYLAYVLLRVPLPLTVIQILAIDLGTDLLPALGLGAERPDPAVMHRPPRPASERLLTTPLLLRAYGFLGLIEGLAGLTTFFLFLLAAGWRFGDLEIHQSSPLFSPYLQATTACLATIITLQMVNVYLCRSDRDSWRQTGIRGNRLLTLGVITEFLLLGLLVYSHPGNWLFGTRPLPLWIWGAILPGALILAIAEELRKWFARRAGEE